MSNFNYPYLINQLSDRGFGHLKSMIYPLLNYQYMSLEDVSKMELCERVYQLANQYPMTSGKRKNSVFEAYYEIIIHDIVDCFKCKAGSIAEGYRKRAIAIKSETDLDNIKEEQNKYNTILTLFSIYLGLSREVFPDYTKKYAENANIMVDENDAALLKEIREGKAKKDIRDLFKISKQYNRLQENDMIYIHDVILYCVLMEIEGKYGRDIKHESVD